MEGTIIYYNNKLLGFYNNAFIHIRLNTNDPSILIHEYIHYLQSISTLYGMHVFKFWKQELAKKIVEHRSKNENVPDIDYEAFNYNAHSLLQSKGSSIATISPYNTLKILGFKKNIDKYASNLWNKETIFNYKIFFCIDNKLMKYNFGASDIAEGMARLIEQHCFPSNIYTPSLPYNTCEELVNWYYPEFGANKGNIVALCDLALLSEAPGVSFIYLLDVFKKENFIPKNIKEIYDLYEKRLLYVDEKGNQYNLNVAQLKIIGDNITDIDNLYNIDGFHSDVNRWIKEKFNTARRYRLKNSTFISELMELDAGEAQKQILHVLMNVLDIPITIGSDDLVYSGSKSLTTKNLYILLAENEIHNVLHTKEPCRMQNICRKNGCLNKVDHICQTPWLKSNDELLCPFGILWHKWNLTNDN